MPHADPSRKRCAITAVWFRNGSSICHPASVASPHISRELHIRALAYRMQDVALGGLRPEPQRQLHRVAQEPKRIRLLETAPLLAKLPDVELGQARQRCPPGIPFVGRPRLSRAGGSFDKSEPVHRLARRVSALRDRDRTQTSNGSAHCMRQPIEPLPDLGDRRALGPFRACRLALCALCSLAVGQHRGHWPLLNRHPRKKREWDRSHRTTDHAASAKERALLTQHPDL
jgi:hypothetical protein